LQNALKKDGQNSLSWFKSHPSHELYLEWSIMNMVLAEWWP
jgi:hypothetical protein